jgi:DNA-binding transcriptional LysR family regulator
VHIDDVRTFVAAVETGSVSAAAHALHLTQPAVTRRLRRLEDALGIALIDRRRRPFALTDAGQTLLLRCRRLLAAADDLKTLGDERLVPLRELRIGVAHALTEVALTDPVDEVRRAFPAAILRLHTGWSRDLLTRVRSGALDAAIIFLPDPEGAPSGVAADAIGRDHLAIVASAEWPRRACAIRDLREQVWILNPEGCAARAALRRQLARARLPLRVGVETYNYELQLRLIARGRGLGLVPHRVLLRSPTRRRLRTIRVRELVFPLTIWMVAGELASDLGGPVDALSRAVAERLSTRVRGPR